MHPLLSCQTFATHVDDPNWVLFDCRFSLADPDAGRIAFAREHLPNAHYVDLEHDLSAPISATSGRHPLPDSQELAKKLAAWGVSQASHVVVYDDAGGAIAARLWWLMQWLGHEKSHLLDGGIQKWRSEGLPLTQKTTAKRHGTFTAEIQSQHLMNTDQVAKEREHITLIDAREHARFIGRIEPIDPIAGHIPGALNHPFKQNLTEEGCFKSAAQLKQNFDNLIGSAEQRPIVHNCGSGVTACHNIFAMTLAGWSDCKLYPGSWSEWIRNKDHPIAHDAQKKPS